MRSIVVCTVLAGMLLVACSQEPAPAPAQATPEAAAPSKPAEGAARIAIAPDGVHVQYRVYGSGEPALVLIHCWSCDSNYWREQVPEFAKKYTVITVDLAGHGGTDANRSDWSMARFGQDVATALAAVPNQQIILVGHSMGGPVALEAARQLKSRVIGIVGVDTFKQVGGPTPTRAQVDALVKPFEADFIGQTRKIVAEHFFQPSASEELKRKIAYDMSLSPPRVAIPAFRALFAMDYKTVLADVNVPIVAINSDLGEPVNEARIRTLIPKFRAVTIPVTGHFLMMEDPVRFNVALETEVQMLLQSHGS